MRATSEATGRDNRLWRHVLDRTGRRCGVRPLAVRSGAEESRRFSTSWGGVAGVQSTLAVLMERGLDGRRLRFEQPGVALARATPAARFNLIERGRLCRE